jgi:hypothetical protein
MMEMGRLHAAAVAISWVSSMNEPSPVTQATGLPGKARPRPIEVARPEPMARKSPEWYA